MDEGSGSSLWQRLTRLFHSEHTDLVEQAILDATEDGTLEKEERTMLLSVLSLDDTQVQEIMTPRTDVIAVPDTATTAEIAAIIVESGHSRIPVYQEVKDNIVGIIYAKDVLAYVVTNDNCSTPSHTAESIMRPPFFVPETKNVLGLLQEFKVRKQHLAVILDEYGGTSGIVSIEDVIEEIIGDIEDEHDAPREEDILAKTDGTYLVTGRASLSDINEKLPLDIESEEVDTIGGYLSLVAGRVPKNNERLVVDNTLFVILDADAKQVHRIEIISPAPADAVQEQDE